MTFHCASGVHCNHCRKRCNSTWRTQVFGSPDPVCPRSLPLADAGLGDTIARVTTALGIPPCGGCKERQAALNKWIPYGG